MTKLFKDDSTNATRALQIWQILIGKAHNRQTITYKALASLLGYKRADILAGMLGRIMMYCEQNNLPPLTILVVNRGTGLPGAGLTSPTDLHADREKVFEFDWFGLYPPTAEELEQAFKNNSGTNMLNTPATP